MKNFSLITMIAYLATLYFVATHSAFITGCMSKPAQVQTQESKDSAAMVESYLYDHGKLTQENVDSALVSMTRCDSLEAKIDSLKTKLFLSNYKLERVKYYVAITDKKPSQVKFLRGWIKRAIQ